MLTTEASIAIAIAYIDAWKVTQKLATWLIIVAVVDLLFDSLLQSKYNKQTYKQTNTQINNNHNKQTLQQR